MIEKKLHELKTKILRTENINDAMREELANDIFEIEKLASNTEIIGSVIDYRLLEDWEMIQRLDEYTLDGVNWKPVEEWDIGQEYDKHNYNPLRRKK